MNTWDDVLNALSTHEKTTKAAMSLIENKQPELACMLLRDTLLRDKKFVDSAPFIAICTIPALQGYLFGPKFANQQEEINRLKAAARLATNPSKI